MSLSFSNIAAYTKQEIAPLLTEAVFSAKTQGLVKQGGILLPKTKSSVKVPKLSTQANFQTDSCGWDPSGVTALKAGSTYEDFGWSDFQTKFTEQKNKMIAKQLEVAIWQGDTDSTNPNLSNFDGLMKLIDAGSAVNANVSGYVSGGPISTITAANVVSALNGVYKAIPVEIIDMADLKVFVGNDVYRLAVLAYQALNLYNYKVDGDATQTFIIPGTNVELVAVNGLNGTGDIYATTLSNIAMAFDLEAEEENYTIWYSKDNNEVRYRVAFKLGVNVAYTQFCVKFKSAI